MTTCGAKSTPSTYTWWQVCIDLSRSGGMVTARYYTRNRGSVSNDAQTLTRTGAITGTKNYTITNSGAGGDADNYIETLIDTRTVSINYGQTLTFGASISGIYNGATPSVSGVTITRPVEVPLTAGQPSISSITTSGGTASWSDPSDWRGDNSSDFDVQIATNSSFTGASTYSVWNSNSRVFTGLSPNVTYYVRVRAKNSAGTGAWSSSRSFTTLTALPTGGGAPTASVATATTATVTIPSASDWGGDNTGNYSLQVATDAGFSTIVYDVTSSSQSRNLTGLTPGDTYYYRSAPVNGAGTGTYEEGLEFTTPGVPNVPTGLTVTNVGPIGAAFDWDDTTWNGGTGTYVLRLTRTSDMVVAWDETADDTSAFTWPTSLQPNEEYTIEVLARNAYGDSAYSSPVTFNTSAPPVFIKVSGTWRSCTAVYRKVSGTWRNVISTNVKVSGAWR